MAQIASGSGARGNAAVQFYQYVFGIGYERNVGGIERAVRYTFGAVLAVLGVLMLLLPLLSGMANLVAALAILGTGLYLVYEAQVQYCPLNQTIGRSTYKDARDGTGAGDGTGSRDGSDTHQDHNV